MTFYIITNGYTVPGNQDTHDKLYQIRQLQKVVKTLVSYNDLFHMAIDVKNCSHLKLSRALLPNDTFYYYSKIRNVHDEFT